MSNDHHVSSAEFLAGLVSGTASGKSNGYVKAISFRVSVSSLARVDALAGKAKKSRNAMLNLLLSVGLEEVFDRIDQDVFEEIQSREIHAIQTFMDEGFDDSLEE
jgi:predicted DNA-binding protein